LGDSKKLETLDSASPILVFRNAIEIYMTHG